MESDITMNDLLDDRLVRCLSSHGYESPEDLTVQMIYGFDFSALDGVGPGSNDEIYKQIPKLVDGFEVSEFAHISLDQPGNTIARALKHFGVQSRGQLVELYAQELGLTDGPSRLGETGELNFLRDVFVSKFESPE